MRRIAEDYAKIARRHFLAGTRFRTPVEAVEAGARTVEEWCECLANHRQRHTFGNEQTEMASSPMRV